MREVIIPQQRLREEIRGLEEFPASGESRGWVRVLVGYADANGNFAEQQFLTYTIEGSDYEELTAQEAPAWAPGKPAGTYRNADLWHFVDAIRTRTGRVVPQLPAFVREGAMPNMTPGQPQPPIVAPRPGELPKPPVPTGPPQG